MIVNFNSIQKKNDSAIILGSGPSVNAFEEKHLDWLKTVDKWTLNNFVIHDFIVPDYYFVEVKHEINGDLLTKLFKEKKEIYKDVIFFVKGPNAYRGSRILKTVLNDREYNICIYNTNPTVVSQSQCSLGQVLDVSNLFKYKTIYFVGVDLYTSEYFWTDNSRYDKYDTANIYYNYVTQKKGLKHYNDKKTNPHLTGKYVLPFIKNYIAANNINSINLSEKSSLTQIMPTQSIPQ